MAKRFDSNRRTLRKGESQRKDGLYVYRVMIDGKNHSIAASTLDELRKKEDELHKKVDAGIDMDKQTTTLNELADKYLTSKAKSVQITTYQMMERMYNTHIRNDLGKWKLVDIKRSVLKEYYLDLMDGKKALKIGTITRLDSIVKPMFDMAVKDDILMKNPASGVIGEIKSETKSKLKKINALTEEEQDAFVKHVLQMDNHRFVKNLIILLVGTGCRVGEVIGLRWDDIDFQKNVIHINHAVAYITQNGKHVQMIKSPKSASGVRYIPMLEDVRDALLAQKELQEMMGLEQPVIDGYTNFIFLSERGGIFTRENVATQIKQIVYEFNSEHDDMKLPLFTTHQLRHNFATRLCKGTNDLKAIQNILGHSDISLTMNIYADATESGIKESIQSLEGVVFKKDEDDDPTQGGKIIKMPNVM